MEKQRDKAAKRLQRKLDKNNPQSPDSDGAIEGLDGEPVDVIEGEEGQPTEAGNPAPAEDPTP